ncbi:MAG: glycosyltransferase [Caldilineaceae bacterium]|nr:glycosyltransferase [Caldilineaceae bacterium]
MRVSVVATVYNEEKSVKTLMDSLLNQTRQPDEIVICDGGSEDDTVALLNEYAGRLPGLRVVADAGANISQGRNRAVAEAKGPIIACTDAGVRLDSSWLAELVAPFGDEASSEGFRAGAVAGFFVPEVSGPFQLAMGATVLPQVEEVTPSRFLPSSRSVAFTKALWERVGGYPEWLDYCEDLVFDLRILAEEEEPAFAWAPLAIAYFRPRPDLKTFWQQYYRYARGDGKADLWRLRHAVRYATYLLLVPALLGHLFWGQEARWLGGVGLIVGGIVNCARPWRRLRSQARDVSLAERIQAAALVPVVRFVGDAAKMAGYPVGLVWRWRSRHRAEIRWRDA